MPSDVVYIVDDDAAVRRSLRRLLESAGFVTRSFGAPIEFLDAAPNLARGCVLLDVQMAVMSGLEVQAALDRMGSTIPVVVMTGQGDVPTAVRAMKAGAVDFLEKPFDDDVLLQAIERALARSGRPHQAREALEAWNRIAVLSQRERQVLDAIAGGQPNKIIAFRLGISIRTVEVHRSRMMHRLGVRQVAEAVRLLVLAGLTPQGVLRQSP
ncbi:response regulator transcription factor [Bradyrhizobium sp. DASA03068]|uniref:response regulator transcription factor n=1 Tax=Bradyrhizobium sp. BLXBL-01 TaxID=3395915 RepID=UPI001BA9341E|nr:response regulator [Bradyrhizobium liaoningense]MBR1168985.1 response regulator transcription factor [Bradyrhizobium liaoningense]